MIQKSLKYCLNIATIIYNYFAIWFIDRLIRFFQHLVNLIILI